MLKPELVKKLRLWAVAMWLRGSVLAQWRQFLSNLVTFKQFIHKLKEKIGTVRYTFKKAKFLYFIFNKLYFFI